MYKRILLSILYFILSCVSIISLSIILIETVDIFRPVLLISKTFGIGLYKNTDSILELETKKYNVNKKDVITSNLIYEMYYDTFSLKFNELITFDYIYEPVLYHEMEYFLNNYYIEKSTKDKDCDDFAFIMQGRQKEFHWNNHKNTFPRKTFSSAFGIAAGKSKTEDIYHAFNTFIDENRTIWIVEPQTNRMYTPMMYEYTIDKLII